MRRHPCSKGLSGAGHILQVRFELATHAISMTLRLLSRDGSGANPKPVTKSALLQATGEKEKPKMDIDLRSAQGSLKKMQKEATEMSFKKQEDA